MWDVSDVRRDFAEHIHVIRSSVRRRVAGKAQRNPGKDEEKRSLLRPVASENNPLHSPAVPNSGYQTMSDSEHEGISAGIRALKREPTNTEQITIHAEVECSVEDVADFVHLGGDRTMSGASMA